MKLQSDLVRGDIAVTDFPEYVLRMTEEDERNNSMLAQEYWVFMATTLIHLTHLTHLTTET